MQPKPYPLIAGALALALLVPILGYVYLGAFFSIIFLVGYVGGFVLWALAAASADWESVRKPYWLTLAAFVLLHKVEENRVGFFEAVSARITGVPVPDVSVGLIISLLILPVGMWLAVPLLMQREKELGRFLAFTFFASMGLTELAHFVLPLLAGEPYGYFPGMASAVVLCPLGWWGMLRMLRRAPEVGGQEPKIRL